MRVVVVCSLFCLAPAFAGAQVPATLDSLVAIDSASRTAALQRIRESTDSLFTLRELETAARVRADERRARGLPPRSEGCLSADEFDLDSQLKIARQSPDGAAFSQTMQQYREMTDRLDTRLAEAKRTNAWWHLFPSLRQWEREWRGAKEPRTRELLRRTLNGQAIRASLARERRSAAQPGVKGAAPRTSRPAHLHRSTRCHTSHRAHDGGCHRANR